jgi:hypothetical protein
MGEERHVACMKISETHKVSHKILETRDHFKNLDVDGTKLKERGCEVVHRVILT